MLQGISAIVKGSVHHPETQEEASKAGEAATGVLDMKGLHTAVFKEHAWPSC
jgi:hypothetical protein